MTKEEAKKRIIKLRQLIDRYRYGYHVLDKPLVSDAINDSLKNELQKLENQYPEFITPDSPTQRVGGEPLDKFEKIQHKTPMLSLVDVFSFEELEEWKERNAKFLISNSKFLMKSQLPNDQNEDYYCELKLDGLAVSLIYEDGILIRGATRGDGRTGEDVTQNLKTIGAIPLKILNPKSEIRNKSKTQNLNDLNIEIRGEVVISKDDFEKLNVEQKKKGLPLYANPRNIAAGSIRQLDPKVAASRRLSFFGYDIIISNLKSQILKPQLKSKNYLSLKTHHDKHNLLKKMGFPTPPGKVCHGLKEVEKFYQEWQKKRERFSYQVDGVWVGINDNNLFGKLGIVGKTPRGAVAYKWPAKQTTTIIKDIIVQIGRTGVLTPVAILEPTLIVGSTVSRATLHNEEEIHRKDVRIGDTVVIQKAGDVIPEVVEAIKNLRPNKTKIWKMPDRCPVCGSQVRKQTIMQKFQPKAGPPKRALQVEDEVPFAASAKAEKIKNNQSIAYYCTNSKCFAQEKRRLEHFVGKKGMDIEGLGPKIIEQLLEQGLIKDETDLYKLKEGDLEPLERFAEQSSLNLVNAIKASKEVELWRFLYALSIRHIGEETARLTGEYLTNRTNKSNRSNLTSLVKTAKEISLEEWQEIPDIGPIVGRSTYEFFHDKREMEKVGELAKAGVNLKSQISKSLPAGRQVKTISKNSKLKDKTFVITGILESMSREEAHEKIRELGGRPHGSVSAKTDYVVAGKEPGSKYEKALKLGVKILEEKKFMEKITE